MGHRRLRPNATLRAGSWFLLGVVLSCGGRHEAGSGTGAGDTPPSRPEASAPPAPFRIAPNECPPDPASGEVDPWSDVDIIPLPVGPALELQGCESEGEAWVTFRYARPAPVPGFHLVEYRLYEGGGWAVASPRARRSWFVSGEPVFSPDGLWFATANADMEAGYDRNHLDIWRVEEDSVRLVLALEGGAEWGGSEVRWVSNEVVEYHRIAWLAEPVAGRMLDTVRARVTLRDSVWVSELAH